MLKTDSIATNRATRIALRRSFARVNAHVFVVAGWLKLKLLAFSWANVGQRVKFNMFMALLPVERLLSPFSPSPG
jgi:hypothetical protein